MYLQDDRDLRPERTKKKLEKAFSFMIRLRIPGGVCTPEQWLQLDRIARDYANGTLRLTTRQTFQFHGVIKSNLKTTMKAIDAALLDTLAACGDVNRNVLAADQSAPVAARIAAAYELAHDISDASAAAHAGLSRDLARRREDRRAARRRWSSRSTARTYLPRKFKTVVAVPPDNDVDVFAQDLGFIAILDEAGEIAGLERHGRRRHGHDPRRARHLSAHRRRAWASARPRTRSRSPRRS